MMDFLRAYRLMLTTSLKTSLQYKFSFGVNMVSVALVSLADFITTAAILLRFKSVGGWRLAEVALLYGLTTGALGLFRVLGREISEFDDYLVNGEFDSLLIRPWDPLFQLLARKVDIPRLGTPVQGIVVAAVAAIALVRQGGLAPGGALLLPLLLVNGMLVFAGISVMTATFGFWTTRVDELQAITIYAPQTAAQYPLGIFPGWLRGLLLSLLPVGLANYLPLTWLLGKGGAWWLLPVSMAGTALYLWAVWRFWRFGVTKYTSTGS